MVKTSLPRMCRVKTDNVRCTYEQMQGSNFYCYWHRLMRTSMSDQIRESEKRLSRAEVPQRDRVPLAEWPTGERWCAGCQSFVPLFYTTASRCKACASKSSRDRRRETVYGLKPKDARELMALQDEKCAICRKDQRIKSLAVDHNHTTGNVRGFLCQRCNHELLGAAFDSLNILLAACIYLAAPPADGEWVPPEVCGNAIKRAFLAAVEDQGRILAAERRATELSKG
jgi:hypothetical protein